VPAGPFYGYNRPGAKASEAVIQNWWRQGMMGGAKAHYDGIVAFSQTDFTEDLKKITVPVLVMHSEDDQIVPYVASGPLSAKLLKNGFPFSPNAGRYSNFVFFTPNYEVRCGLLVRSQLSGIDKPSSSGSPTQTHLLRKSTPLLDE
jgi:pimeloyl-ACP methyl ester carboxylesterase